MTVNEHEREKGKKNNRKGEKERETRLSLRSLNLLLLPSSKKKKKKTAFEGDEYYKHEVTATLLPGEGGATEEGEEAEAEAEKEEQKLSTFLYCWAESAKADLLPEDWDYDSFRAEHLSRYVEMCSGFEEELREDAGRAASAAARGGGGSGGGGGE